MSKTYVIQWKSKVNGRAGKGTKLFDLEEAQALVEELNQGYPDIDHDVLNTETQIEPLPPDQAPKPQTPEENEPAPLPNKPTPALSFSR